MTTIGAGKNKRNHVLLKLLLFLCIIVGLALIVYQTGLGTIFFQRERLREFLISLGPWAFLGFIFLQAFQVVAAPLPGELTGLLGGYLYGPLIGILLSTVGLTMGSSAAFFLSRTFGRPFVEKIVKKKTMERFDYLLHHKGAFLAFLLFLIPGFPKDYLCYILGLGHISAKEFIAIAGTGRLLGTVLLTLGGSYIRNQQYSRLFILTGVSLVVTFVAMAYRDKLEKWFRFLHSDKG